MNRILQWCRHFVHLDAGVTLDVQPVSPDMIREYSTMNRSLCVILADVGAGLERQVSVDIDFVPEMYSRSSMLCVLIWRNFWCAG